MRRLLLVLAVLVCGCSKQPDLTPEQVRALNTIEDIKQHVQDPKVKARLAKDDAKLKKSADELKAMLNK